MNGIEIVGMRHLSVMEPHEPLAPALGELQDAVFENVQVRRVERLFVDA
jgi:hypothetical protein